MKNFTYAFTFAFERNFDFLKMRRYMSQNWHFSLYIGVLYLIVVKLGQYMMKNRAPMKVRTVLISWNVGMAFFSLMGSYRVLPESFHILRYHGFHGLLCNNSYGVNNVTAFWGFLFTMSKMVELVETCFIVARKHPVRFVHLFHHVVTMFVTWSLFAEAPAIARVLVNANLCIHTVMYAYFASKIAQFRVPEWVSIMITSSQILQMFFGLACIVYVGFLLSSGSPCEVSVSAFLITFIAYSSLLYLFVRFFIQKYLVVQRPKNADKTE